MPNLSNLNDSQFSYNEIKEFYLKNSFYYIFWKFDLCDNNTIDLRFN